MGAANEASKQKKEEKHHEKQEKLHDALEDSFPASDPPAWGSASSRLEQAIWCPSTPLE